MKAIFLLALFFVISSLISAQPTVSFQPIVPSGLSSPVDVVSPPDASGRLFVVERTGTIRIVTGNTVNPTPFLNVTSIIRATSGEQGLLSLAFHPQYTTNRFFFIYYTDLDGSVAVSRYQVSTANPDVADVTTGVNLLTIPKRFANHNGGKLLFGNDGYLYFGTGDGGSGGDPDNNAQNPASLLGKMLRIDVNNASTLSPYYAIPVTNPYRSNAAYRPEILATGLRNPWRYSFDKSTGDLWLPDVGQDLYEEVNFTPAGNISGRNYGWSCYEATHVFKTNCGAPGGSLFDSPIFEYPHNNSNGGFSITGGFVYRGTEFPALQGYYLVTDFVTGNGWLIRSNGAGGFTVSTQSWPDQISSFGEASDGTLYATRLNGGLYKVVASQTLPVRLVSFSGRIANNRHELSWEVAGEGDGDMYIIEKRTTLSQPFIEAYRTFSLANTSRNNYIANISLNNNESSFYRLKIIGRDGRIHYSSVVHLKDVYNNFRATVSAGNLYLSLPNNARTVTLFNAEGKLLKQQNVAANTQLTMLSLNGLQRGVIIVKVISDEGLSTTKVIY